MKLVHSVFALVVMATAACGGSPVTDASSEPDAVAPTDATADAGDVLHVTDVTDVVDAADVAVDAGTRDVQSTDVIVLDVAADVPADVAPIDTGVDVPPVACTLNSDCTDLQFCDGMGCGTPGTCAARPVTCVPTDNPVCGCDGVTYPDVCAAHLAFERVASTGACPTDAGTPVDVPAVDVPVTGGCTDASGCAATEYCATTGACGSVGACTPRPVVCPLVCYANCGCDGMMYCNPCVAHRAGVNIAHTGTCP